MARTDEENCEILCATYDRLLDAFALSPTGPIEITIRGRTVRYPEPGKTLRSLEEAIARCKARAIASGGGNNPARNRVRLIRDHCVADNRTCY